MKTFFNTTVKYQKQNDEGLLKEITEQYLVDAVNFTEAEAKVIEYLAPEVSGGVSVARVSKTNISSIIDNVITSLKNMYPHIIPKTGRK